MDMTKPNWLPLERHIGERCAEWMWMYRRLALEHYKHVHTRQYLILDRKGQAYGWRDGELVPVLFDVEYRRATRGYSTEHYPVQE